MTAVFTHSSSQNETARITKAQQERTRGQLHTTILPLDTFYLAEDYHQKYSLRQFPGLEAEFRAIYPELEDFINSTAVTRVNAIAGGYGSTDLLTAELDNYGLSELGRLKLRQIAAKYE